jgi:transmembrane sensor
MPRAAIDHNEREAAPSARAGRLHPLPVWRIAAAVALLALLVMPLPLLSPFAPSTAYATSVRQMRTVTIAQGVRVELSPLAVLRVENVGREQRALLQSGVGYFEIAPGSAPFVVVTRFGDIRGGAIPGGAIQGGASPGGAGAFVVRIDENGAVVTVLAGTVGAFPQHGHSLLARLAAQASRPLPVAAGHELALAGAQAPIALAHEAVSERLAWREGHVALDHARLGDAALEVTRFSGVRFEFADPALAEVRVSGYFSGGDVEAFCAALRANFAMIATRDGSAIRLARSR